MVIGVYIGSELTGFFSSIAKVLSEEHKVVLVVQNHMVKKYAQAISGIPDERIIVQSDYDGTVPEENVQAECLAREAKYGFLFSELMIYDRSVARGYLFNAELIPHIGRSWWPLRKRQNYLLSKIRLAEMLVEQYGLQMFISIVSVVFFSRVLAHHKIPYLTFYPVKFGSRMHWADDETATSSKMRTIMAEALADPAEAIRDVEYAQEFTSAYNHKQIRYTYGAALKTAARNLASDIKARLRGRQKIDSYCLGGWVLPILNKPRMFHYFEKHGRKPEDLEGQRLVYIPLSYEPEISLYGFSPEFNNTIEMIALVSRVLPADMKIVVKEQPFTFGVRSRRYCDYLRQMGNVILAHPSVHSWEWIKASDLVVTVTGTVAIEAVYFKRPSIVFGKNHIVRDLPCARFACCYDDLRRAVPELLALKPDAEEFRRSAHALFRAQMGVSLEMPGFEKSYASKGPDEKYARMALAKLGEVYPEVLS
ncbi:capsular polysaccharide export protein, LipB/KpsS family [Desulfocurvus sp. DL9XJH121]